jgi:hypothetical protein
LTGNSLPHDVQRMVTAFQPILSTTSLPHALHFMNTFDQLKKFTAEIAETAKGSGDTSRLKFLKANCSCSLFFSASSSVKISLHDVQLDR